MTNCPSKPEGRRPKTERSPRAEVRTPPATKADAERFSVLLSGLDVAETHNVSQQHHL
jgi:hypothetical protein